MRFKTIAVIGLGYIGLPTAALFASRKQRVIGVDVKQEVVDTINQGKIHIVEPQLEQMVRAAVTSGYLTATTQPEPADAFIIAVPTPFKKAIGEPDLNCIQSAVELIAPVLNKGNLVVLESTSPVGTTEQLGEWLAALRPDLTFPQQQGEQSDVRLAYCPERVMPGQVIRELVENNRVIGGMTGKCSEQVIALYKTFARGECIVTGVRTAEMVKLTENACRDVQIAFANELSMICDRLAIDVWELIALANRHPRIDILQPGPGVGGHCIAVDPWFIISKTPAEAKLMRMARRVNDSKPLWVIDKVKLAIADFLQANPEKTAKEVTVVCYGLTFKADIDDLRESPALTIVEAIAKIHVGKTVAVEPHISRLPKPVKNLRLSHNLEEGKEADIVLLLVDHKEFKSLRGLDCNIIIDTRGIWQ